MQSEQELEGFRAELRDWLEANCPAEMRGGEPSEASICWGGKNFEFESDAQRDWMERAASKGYTVPTWPVEYGGAGLTRPHPRRGEGARQSRTRVWLGCRRWPGSQRVRNEFMRVRLSFTRCRSLRA